MLIFLKVSASCEWISFFQQCYIMHIFINRKPARKEIVMDLTLNDPHNRIHVIRVFRHVGASDQA